MTINIEQPEDWDLPYTFADATRAVIELVTSRGDEGMHKDDIVVAIGMFNDLFTSAAYLHLWMERKVTLGWHNGELTFMAVVDDEQGGD